MGIIISIGSWLPLFWLLFAIALGMLEAFTVDLVAIWFAIGATVAIIPAMLGLSFWIQLVVFLIVSLLTLAFTRPVAKDVLKVRKTSTNADSVIGMVGIVTEEIDNLEERGRVRVNGLDWSARSDDGAPIARSERVLIKGIQGVKVIVERVL